ncbi:MAG: hypothetical protein ACI4PH_10535, partial [Faecousia sp.]
QQQYNNSLHKMIFLSRKAFFDFQGIILYFAKVVKYFFSFFPYFVRMHGWDSASALYFGKVSDKKTLPADPSIGKSSFSVRRGQHP